jgi:hypothetical protein
VFRGEYRKKVKVDDIPGGAVLYDFAKHAPIIEGGRRPGSKMPPLDTLEEWVRLKGVGVALGTKQKGKKAPGRTASLRGLAFVIGRAIARRGLPALRIVEKASAKLDRFVREGLARDLGGKPGA